MELKQRFFEEYALKAAVDQMAEEYRAKGYEVEKEAHLGTARADLIARHGEDLLIFEFKGYEADPDKGVALKQLRNYVGHHPNARLKLVLVKPPQHTTVQIDGLQRILYDLCSDPERVRGLSQVAPNWRLDEINDVALEDVQITSVGVEVKGSATALYTLQLAMDDSTELTYPFPVAFHLALDPRLEMGAVQSFSVDVADF
jgi:REase_AHJR-like